MHADFTGHAPGSGPGLGISMATVSGHRGGAGGGHGGRGGRPHGGYYSAFAHDSMYTPRHKGSGGGQGANSAATGGRGGGMYLVYSIHAAMSMLYNGGNR